MSATTLSVHEEMLKHQQRKIEELQKELQRSQDQLKHQQQVIVAAKKAQTFNGGENSGSKSIRETEAEAWLANIDTKHLQKFHIQHFLQHKLQQQQLQSLNLQQELVETQQKLRDEFGLEQSVHDIGRIIKQDPRVANLMLHLLRKYQQGPSQNSLPVSTAASNSPNYASGRTTNAKTNSKTKNASSGGSANGEKAPSSTQSAGGQVTPQNTGGSGSKQGGGSKSAAKNRQNNSGTKKSSIVKSNSLPTSPSKLKGLKASLAASDMEEIFRAVLEYASKATQKLHSANNNDDDPQDHSDIDSKQNADFSAEAGEPKSETQKLPSCDQLIPSLRGSEEPQSCMGVGTDVGGGQDGGGMCSMSNGGGNVNNVPSLGSLLMNNLPSAVDMLHSDQSYIYTKNEAFEDLMEVLRNNGGQVTQNPELFDFDCVGNINKSRSMNGTDGSFYPNTFGAQELADLLGNDWLNSSTSVGPPVPSAACSVTAPSFLGNLTHSVTVSGSGNFYQLFNGVQERRQKTEEQMSSVAGGLSSVHSEPNLQQSANLNSSGSFQTGFDLGSSYSFENAEQMDWLDLILPSPAGLDLPPNPPSGDSGFLEQDSASRPHNTTSGVTPMDVEHYNTSPTDLIRVSGMVPSIRGSCGNPVLAQQNTICGSDVDGFDLGV